MKWRYLPVSIFIFVFSLEVLLRLISWGLSLVQQTPFSDRLNVRIVTLGESTSTDNFEGVLTWPQQLQIKLQQQGIKAEVINLSKPGTNSFYLVQKLKSRIWSLRPQIVVAMMGVNDAIRLKMAESFWLRNFYLARLYKWYQFLNQDDYSDLNKNMHNKKGINRSETDFEASLTQNEIIQLESKTSDYLRELESIDIKDVVKSAENIYTTDPKGSKYILYRTVNRLFANMNLEQYRKFILLNEYLLAKGYFDENIIYYRLYSDWSERNIKNCADFTHSMWSRYDYQFSERHLSMIANCVSKASPEQHLLFDGVIQKQQLGYHFAQTKNAAEHMTAQSYLQLLELAESHNFILVVMQYPLENIENLKSYFTAEQTPKITFVSNFENFNERLKTQKFEELFLDHFAKNFGHPSEAGHKLITEKLSEAIGPLLKQE